MRVGCASIVLRVGTDPSQTLQVGLAGHGGFGEAGVSPHTFRWHGLGVGVGAGVSGWAILVTGANTQAKVSVEAWEARSCDRLGVEEGGLGAVKAKATSTRRVQKGGCADEGFLVDEVWPQSVQLKVSVVSTLDGHVADGDRKGCFHAAGTISAVRAVHRSRVLGGVGGGGGARGFLVGVGATAVTSGAALATL